MNQKPLNELREEFIKIYAPVVKHGGITYADTLDGIADWWLSKFQAYKDNVRREVDKLIKKHKEVACVLADVPEYDPTNMTRHIENTLAAKIVFNHIDFTRELQDILKALEL